MPVKKAASQEKPGQDVAERAKLAANRRKAAPSSPNTENTESAAQPLQAVVGMVASAGDLEAFKQFFQAMPAHSGLAFVLIPHLDPKHERLMAPLPDKLADEQLLLVIFQAEPEVPQAASAGDERARIDEQLMRQPEYELKTTRVGNWSAATRKSCR